MLHDVFPFLLKFYSRTGLKLTRGAKGCKNSESIEMLSNIAIHTPVSASTGAAASAVTAGKTPGHGSRCKTCRAKLGLLPFACRCGGSFCASHISSVAHACEFDYRAHQSKILSEQLDTKGLHEKVEKI